MTRGTLVAMESSSQSARSSLPVDRVVLALLVWAGSVWLSAPGLTWLDSSELAAAGVTLGVPHAPGHPLYIVLAHLASLVPIGSAAFRVALLSGAFAAAAAWMTADLVEELAWDQASRGSLKVAGFLVALLLCISTAVWQQAVRAEVYTLHLALVLWATRDALRWRRAAPSRRPALLASVAFTLGLACANHHLLTALHLPAMLILLLAPPPNEGGARGVRLIRAILWAAPAAVLYAVLPLRASADPLFNYGDPRTVGRLWDVMTASVFQASVTETTSPVLANLGVAFEMLHDTIGAPILILGAAGAWLLVRRAPILAATCLLAIIGNLASKVSMVIDPSNPDAFGYFQLSLALIAAMAGVSIAWALDHASNVVRLTAVCTIGFAVLWTGTASALSFEHLDHRRESSTALTDMALLEAAPPGTLWLTSNTFLHFNRLGHQAVDGYRPDVLTVHQGLERHVEEGAPLRETLRRRDPNLTPFLDAASETDNFPVAAALELSRERPVMVEPSITQPFPVDALRYDGGYLRVASGSSTTPEGLEAQRLDEAQLRVAVGDAFHRKREARTVHALLWLQLAVVRLQRGEPASAALALDHVSTIAPSSGRYIERLRPFVEALETRGGPKGHGLNLIRRTDFTLLFE